MMPGLYKFQNIAADIVGVFTNAVPTDAYRGAGRPEATHGIERMVDILAAELKMDPVEIRLKNFVGNDQFPFATATGLSYDSGNYAAPLKRALKEVNYESLRREQAEARKAGRLMGIGISTYGEICAMGPSAALPAGGWESATVKIEPTGKVTVMTGASPHGQGEETTFAQIVADELGVDIDDVVVIHGDTGSGPIWHRHLRQPRHGRRRSGALRSVAGIESQGSQVRRHAAGRCRLRHFRRRRVHRRSYRQIGKIRRNRRRRVSRQEASAQNRTRPGGNAFLGAAELHVPLRRAHRGTRM